MKHIFLSLHPRLRLLTFEAFSLSLSDHGTKPGIKMLFVSVLQVIVKLRIIIVISSVVSIVLKLFVPMCSTILSDFCSTVRMFCPVYQFQLYRWNFVFE